jgi:hypothetical protein
MSNQVGDRYTCSDPKCGCEVEIQRPCSTFSGDTGETMDEAAGTTVRPSGYEYRSEQISTSDDYGGSQGATGEGTFGAAGTGDSGSLASGRYDTASTRVRESSRPAARALTCFCGSKMRQIGSQQRAQAAQIPSR